MKYISARLRYSIKTILRSPIKTCLIAAFSLLSIFATAFLGHVIENNKAEVERLFDEALVTGYFEPSNPAVNPAATNFISPRIVNALEESPFVSLLYTESHEVQMVIRLLPGGSTEQDAEEQAFLSPYQGSMIGTSDINMFVTFNRDYHEGHPFGTAFAFAPDGNFNYEFAPGFDESSFIFAEGQPIPIIAERRLLNWFGLEMGDAAVVSRTIGFLPGRAVVQTVDAVIIGSFSGGHRFGIGRFQDPPVIMPIEALSRFMNIPNMPFYITRFHINQAFNRYIDDFIAKMQPVLTANPGVVMEVDDADLRLAIGPLEQGLRILQQLYPITLVVTALLAAGLAVLLTIKSAKYAAIMRALGCKRLTTAFVMWAEYLAVCIFGVLLSPLLMLATGMDILAISPVAVALYFLGSAVGAVVGAVVISNRPPLELLQVRE